jgi:dihydrodipicolinate synthase/N-acetylneuraminate lyase
LTGHDVRARLLEGLVIPAHPLALTAARTLDERRQRALTRYYVAAGAGGIAVGVHTTQFGIHDPTVGLLEPVLALAAETVADAAGPADATVVRVAGVVGGTAQAVREAEVARRLGYDVALVSLAAVPDEEPEALVAHMAAVGSVLPVMGFYLQPAVGGRELPYRFWRLLLELESLAAIKVAPFDRGRTREVARAVADAGRRDVALYTGNDDHIVGDLLAAFPGGPGRPALRMAGGLLGQWAMWTREAVHLHGRCRRVVRGEDGPDPELTELGAHLTETNAAIFDAARGFRGCLPGIHEVLRRQGLLEGRWCLDPAEDLSPGQLEDIDRVLDAYPHLADDEFVREHRDAWLR